MLFQTSTTSIYFFSLVKYAISTHILNSTGIRILKKAGFMFMRKNFKTVETQTKIWIFFLSSHFETTYKKE